MNPIPRTCLSFPALLLCGAFAAVPAWAAPTTDRAELAELAARHRQERTSCLNVQEAEARADCVRDADAAYGHARRNRPSDIVAPFARNASLRCDALRGDDRRDCLARMDGQGTTTGSVAGGGIYRELVVLETMAVPMPASPAASAAPTSLAPLTMPATPTTPATVTPPAPKTMALPSATNPPTPK